MARRNNYTKRRADGYRSGLEKRVGDSLEDRGVPFEYEALKVPFVQPAKNRRYTPDFILPNGIVIEAKGRLTTKNRQKHKFIQDSHPDLDLRFVFSNMNRTISKRSSTTYAEWCDRYGFLCADKTIPLEWLEEPPNEVSLAVLEEIRNHRLNQ